MTVAPAYSQSNYSIIDLAVVRTRAFMASPPQETAMRARPDKRSALNAFVARKAEIDNMLGRLKALSDENFGYSPDAIHWGHVGSLDHYADLLRRITDAAFKEGEYAE
jgi:hypothetical protein